MFKIIERVYNNIVVEKVNAFYGLTELIYGNCCFLCTGILILNFKDA